MSGYDDLDLKTAWSEGYKDFLNNVPKLDNPYDDVELKAAWLDGWNDANEDEGR